MASTGNARSSTVGRPACRLLALVVYLLCGLTTGSASAVSRIKQEFAGLGCDSPEGFVEPGDGCEADYVSDVRMRIAGPGVWHGSRGLAAILRVNDLPSGPDGFKPKGVPKHFNVSDAVMDWMILRWHPPRRQWPPVRPPRERKVGSW